MVGQRMGACAIQPKKDRLVDILLREDGDLNGKG